MCILCCRKLAELGFKRSAEKCKEKFEEESRNLNSINFNKSFRFFSELDKLYQQSDNNKKNQINNDNTRNSPRSRRDNQAQSLEEGSGNVENEEVLMMRSSTTSSKSNVDEKRKRKRRRQFEMFKGFCEAIVERIMAQQEELHNKIIEDMVKREEEKIARDEAWKSQEMDRLNKEIEIREKEHEIASNRQAKIIEFLNNFSPNSPQDQSLFNKFDDLFQVPKSPNPKKSKKLSPFSSSTPLPPHQNPSSNPPQTNTTNPSSTPTMDLAPQNPNSESKDTPLEPTPSKSQPSDQNGGGDVGKRWPREEVLALINLRCSLNNSENSKDGAKGPLWERISQGMQELGYKRSAKRCKEKWENINKYFRKTKDNNKKRSLDSRTCPYFHQLSTLYSQGKLRGESPENRSTD